MYKNRSNKNSEQFSVKCVKVSEICNYKKKYDRNRVINENRIQLLNSFIEPNIFSFIYE